MDRVQPSFTDVEYGQRRRDSRREQFLAMMDATVPWARLVGLIGPHYYCNTRGRKAKQIETMLRMYLLQVWFSLSDEGVEEAIYDSYAVRKFMGLDFTVDQVPDATTLWLSGFLLRTPVGGQGVRGAQFRLGQEAVRNRVTTMNEDVRSPARTSAAGGATSRRSSISTGIIVAISAAVLCLVVGGVVWALNAGENTEAAQFHEDQPVVSDGGACDKGTSANALADVPDVADLVVVGRVESAEPKPDAPKGNFLPRILTVSVDRTISGLEPDSPLLIEDTGWMRLADGDDGWYPMLVDGWPRLAAGDSAILPIQLQENGTYSFLCSGPLLLQDGVVIDPGGMNSVNAEAYGQRVDAVASQLSG